MHFMFFYIFCFHWPKCSNTYMQCYFCNRYAFISYSFK